MIYEIGQRVEIHGLPDIGADYQFNGDVVTIVSLPGSMMVNRVAYGILFETGPKAGQVIGAVPQFLRPARPNGRGDLDRKTSWYAFDQATGLDSTTFRVGRSNPDY